MAKILYVYNDQVYANITNKCDCNCTFCIRKQFDGVGDADTLWHKAEPSLSEIIAAIDAFDFTGYKEFVFCGYGEPTCALENLIASARYVKEKTGLPIRVNSNGLGNLYYKRDIVPQLAEVVDSISISLNEATAEKYEKVTRPSFPHAYEACLILQRNVENLSHTRSCRSWIFFRKKTLRRVSASPTAAVSI